MGDASDCPHLLPQHPTLGKLRRLKPLRPNNQRRLASFARGSLEVAPRNFLCDWHCVARWALLRQTSTIRTSSACIM